MKQTDEEYIRLSPSLADEEYRIAAARECMKVIGIDPGFTGALVCLQRNKIISYIDMPVKEVNGRTALDIPIVSAWLVDQHNGSFYPPIRVVIEHVHAAPKQGVSSVFRFGEQFGILQALAHEIIGPPLLVSPQKWQAFARFESGDTKSAGRARAVALFPDAANIFARVKDHGRADAALIAHWGLTSGVLEP